MERQGLIGDLESKTKEQLWEILSRQEKLLSNKRFVQTLPDKGKKISEFVGKVRRALANKEEKEKQRAGLESVRSESRAGHQQAFTGRQRVVSTDGPAAGGGRDRGAADAAGGSGGENRSESLLCETTSGDDAALGDLVVAFERVALSEQRSDPPGDPTRNPFSGSRQRKKPHYLEVLEKSGRNETKPPFRLNQLPAKSPASPSPVESPGSVTPLSAEARRHRDRKHLDDITAAKLPPLHHSPAQLLSLEESVGLLQEQTKKHQELQAKLAAQKLAEGLTAVSMNTYHPEGGALAAYREVHDDEDLSEKD